MKIKGVSYLGNKLDFVIEDDVKITLASQKGLSPPLEVILGGNVYPLELKKTVFLPQKKAVLRMRKPLFLKAQACDHTTHWMLIFFLASLCVYYIIRDTYF